METLECIKTRRSVRKFKTDSVSKETIEKLVLAASYAPSWKNTQTTRYIAITNEEVKARLATECCAEHNAQIINGAPLLIATLIVDKRSGFERDGSFSTSRKDAWQAFDNGIATINTEVCDQLGYDFDEISKTFEPLCTAVKGIETAEEFEEESESETETEEESTEAQEK